jgi:hypothetical protein
MNLKQKTPRSFPTRKRKYTLNEGAFEVITEESAYRIGFIMADGCISRDRTSDCRRLRINLKTSDAHHLWRLRNFLQFEGPVAVRDNGRYCALEINSARLATSLRQYGVIEKKSRRASVIHLDTNVHFWRGMIDGDGTLYLSKNMYPTLSLCGSEIILGQFVAYVRTIFPSIKISIRKRASIKQLAVAGQKAIILTRHFYGDCSIALDRKLQLAKTIMSLCPN